MERKSRSDENTHTVVLSLQKEQRTSFSDAKPEPNMSPEMLTYFKCMKYKEMYRPYNDFLLYESSILIANDNILSCYDVNAEQFVDHEVFGDNDQQDVNNPVCSIFRYKDNSYGIGVLLQNGKIKQCTIEDTNFGRDLKQEDKGNITGKIKSFAEDKHHNSALFVISRDNLF